MRSVTLAASCALLVACFSKPTFNGAGDGGIDAPTDGPPIDPGAPAVIAAGGAHACRINATGRILCWGIQDHGQLGDRAVAFPGWTGQPAFASPDEGWSSIAAGVQHTCAIRNATVYCWGENNFTQSAPQLGRQVAIGITPVTLPAPAERVFAGGFTTCAITTTHEAYCWGRLELQLDLFPVTNLPLEPTRLGTTTFRQIAIHDYHACALGDDGSVHCWGRGGQKQTGRNDTADVPFTSAGPIESTKRFTSLSAGYEVTCGISTDAELACWGSGNRGQLGPVGSGGHGVQIIGPSRTRTSVAVGYDHVCAVSGGDVYCYGRNVTGALGRGQFAGDELLGANVATGYAVSRVAANDGYSCALSGDGNALKCWGRNTKGELGNHEFTRKIVPTEAALPPGVTATRVIAGDHHTCALTATGTAYCWGLNDKGQVGTTPTAALEASPVTASAATFTKLTAGEKHTCGIQTGGAQIECWGDNAQRQLGDTNLASRRNIVSGASWTDLSAGSRMSCGINNGDLACWGERPGESPTDALRTYNRIGASLPWVSISVGSGFAVGVSYNSSTSRYHFAGLGSGAKPRCAAGLVTSDPDNMPAEILSGLQPVTTLPLVSTAQAGGEHSCVHLGTTMYCMGGPTVALPQVGGGVVCGTANTNVRTVASGWRTATGMDPGMFATADQTCALSTGNRILCWGSPSNFELGAFLGGATPGEAFAPMAWPGQWTSIAGGRDHTCGISAANNRVYCWGENQYGQVGDGSSYEPSPVDSGAL